MPRLRLLGGLLALLLAGSGCTAGLAPPPAAGSAADTAETRLEQARLALRGPNRDAALTDLETLARELEARLEKHPEEARLHGLLARTAFYLRREEKALAEARRALALAPDQAEPHYILAFLLGGRNKAGDALAHATRATELAPQHGRYWQLLGTLYLQLDKPAEARAALDKTLALEPDNAQAHIALGMLSMDQDRPDEALERFQKAADLEPRDWKTRARLVQLHQTLGHKEKRDAEREALRLLRQAGKVDQDYFVREQFQEAGRDVLVVENFELEGDWAKRYEFQVYGPDKERPVLVVSLGSYAYANALAREKDPTGPRLFHLDAYSPDNAHETYGFFKGEPSYDETREMVLSILRGEQTPLSTTKLP
jgi:Flp pilus assembly protein TadD